jgi:hypothetical protein
MPDTFRALATTPWAMTDAHSWQLRMENRFNPGCGKVNRLVEQLRAETSVDFPWVDPFCGGVDAQLLLVLKRPGPLGAMATRFLSLANTDQTAKNTIAAVQQAGLAYGDLLFWNAIPWSGPRDEKLTPAMRQRGEAMLGRLLRVLPRLRAVLLLGGDAHPLRSAIERWRSEISVIACAHTSPLAWNQARHREGILAAFRAAAAALGKPGR